MRTIYSVMPTIAAELDAAFRSAITAALATEADPQISVSQNPKFGDYQSNAAMGLAKLLAEKTGQRTNPRAVAEQIVARLDLGPMASNVSIAGPGFINVKLSPAFLGQRLSLAAADDRLGIPLAAPQTVVIDYSGPNVSKQMHVGHLRPTNIGDAISRILEFAGHRLIRQNHIGDWGTSFGMLLAHLKTTPSADATAQIADLETFYRNAKVRFDEEPGFADLSREMVVKLQSGGAEEIALWQRIVEQSRRHFESIYDRLGVRLTRTDERGESFYNAELPKVVQELIDRGVAVESEGAIVVWVEGFEAPLIVRKSGGGFGYAATDLAAVRYRVQTLHADWLIYTTDARQAQHFKQFFDAALRAGWLENVRIDHITFGTILGADGKPFKSKSGDNVKMKDLLDEAEARALAVVEMKNPDLSPEKRGAIARAVGIGAIKYYDLARDWQGNYVFDWDKILALDGNTAPYLQYAYARICSIFRRAKERDIATPAARMQIEVVEPAEMHLALHLLRLGEALSSVYRDLKPHVLCTYLYDLATLFSRFFESCPVLQSAEPIRAHRLALCDIAARTLGLGLDLLGIEHPEQM